MSVKLRCEVCGAVGHKDKWYKEPYYDDWGRLRNAPFGDRGQIGHREKIFYFEYGNGITRGGYSYRRVGVALCDPCHTIAPSSSSDSVFETRDEIHKHFDKKFKFRALAKNMEIAEDDTSSPMSMVLYTHYNKEFAEGLVVKIPGSDDPLTKNNILKQSSFKYVKVTKVYPKETIPEWSAECGVQKEEPFKSKDGINFDYYVEVLPTEKPE